MPTYELSVILRQMTRPEIVSTLKRTAETILNNGGIIRKLENLGTRELPHKMSEHGMVHRHGSYFLVQFDSATHLIEDFNEEFGRDVDIVRSSIFKTQNPEFIRCTLHEELLPPAYRKEVIEMMKLAQRKAKPKYRQQSGLDYYPFQK
ncbi:putative 28S ribosomal protein S6, mitochondrial [Pseudolycoriella hygida]|uniref:Small ribosomal subunit protein bS6m n=1 Tax=Pseudolycoriella hygida TaxID=35572 RepID=A0A9Q0MR34_9DIPT|nr:putative 28S ribosomal protein S6, mitochondrial [Pseudolycoriella hygida]